MIQVSIIMVIAWYVQSVGCVESQKTKSQKASNLVLCVEGLSEAGNNKQKNTNFLFLNSS